MTTKESFVNLEVWLSVSIFLQVEYQSASGLCVCISGRDALYPYSCLAEAKFSVSDQKLIQST